MRDSICKVLTLEQWERAKTQKIFEGSVDDLRDGFIHFSTFGQLAGTINKHFGDQPELVVLVIDCHWLGDQLKWETSRDGEEFPHLYGALPLEHVREVHQIRWEKDKGHQIPPAIFGK